MKKFLHIAGIVCGYLAAIGLVVAGILIDRRVITVNQSPGKLITWGITLAVGATVAIIDGARAMPQLGIWKVGAKFEGLSDLAVIIIIAILGIGFGISMAF